MHSAPLSSSVLKTSSSNGGRSSHPDGWAMHEKLGRWSEKKIERQQDVQESMPFQLMHSYGIAELLTSQSS